MKFDAVLRRIGNSVGIIIPKDIIVITGKKIGEQIELEVIGLSNSQKAKAIPVITIPPPVKIEMDEPLRMITNPQCKRFTGEMTKER